MPGGLRIAHISKSLLGGGAQRRTLRTVEKLAGLDAVECALFSRSPGSDEVVERVAESVPVHLPGSSLLNPFELLRWRRAVLEFEPDVIHLWQTPTDICWARLLFGSQFPTVYSFLSSDPELMARGSRAGSLVHRVPAWLMGERTAYYFNSDQGKELWSAKCGFVEERCHVVPNLIEPEELVDYSEAERRERLEELGCNPELPVLITVARLKQPEKGIDVLLDALYQMLEQRGDFTYLIVGDGRDASKLRRRVERSGLGRVVHFTGWREDTAELLALADLFVLPSRTEGFPNALVEALQQNLPVVATRVGAVPEIVQGMNGTLTVPPNDSAALQDALSEALGRLEELTDGARKHREVLLERYADRKVLDRMVEMYRAAAALGE